MSGVNVLKDKNLTILNKLDTSGKIVHIKSSQRKDLLELLIKDTEFLKKHGLMDYSLFLIQANNVEEKKNERDQGKTFMKLVYDKKNKGYKLDNVCCKAVAAANNTQRSTVAAF